MWNYYYGEIILLPYNFTPQGCFPCDGRLLSGKEYPCLLALLGCTYGGNQSERTFNIPNLLGMEPAKGLKYYIVCDGAEYPIRE